jgi:thioredoxin 1
MANVAEFTDQNFEAEVLKSTLPVLVDFWAPWCGPCRQIAPLIEQLATTNAGAVKVGKLDVDQSPKTAQAYGVMNIPTLLIFKNGDVVQRFVGVQSPSRLQAALDQVKG